MQWHQKIHLINEMTSSAPSENSRFPLWLLLFGLDDLLISINIFAQHVNRILFVTKKLTPYALLLSYVL